MRPFPLLGMIFGLMAALPVLGEELPEQARLSVPPASLAQWYPPHQEQPVFFFNMLTLGRAMQATGDYATLQDRERLKKWATRLVEGYRKVREMVPEWEGELELQWADRLTRAAAEGDYDTVDKALRRLGTSCRSCHNEYRTATRVLYHVPDYHEVMIESSETLEEIPYPDAMEDLAILMNRIAIATEDGRQASARQALERFGTLMMDMAASCSACHEDAKAVVGRVYGTDTESRLTALGAAVERGDARALHGELGRIGGSVCASCHGVHKPAAAMRHELVHQAREH